MKHPWFTAGAKQMTTGRWIVLPAGFAGNQAFVERIRRVTSIGRSERAAGLLLFDFGSMKCPPMRKSQSDACDTPEKPVKAITAAPVSALLNDLLMTCLTRLLK